MEKKCYTCAFRGEVPGSAHSCCHAIRSMFENPNDQRAVILEASAAFGVDSKSERFLTEQQLKGIKSVEVNEWGKKNGWALWPLNFDPTWIEKCGLYRDKTS